MVVSWLPAVWSQGKGGIKEVRRAWENRSPWSIQIVPPRIVKLSESSIQIMFPDRWAAISGVMDIRKVMLHEMRDQPPAMSQSNMLLLGENSAAALKARVASRSSLYVPKTTLKYLEG